jgi:hypothetical protein
VKANQHFQDYKEQSSLCRITSEIRSSNNKVKLNIFEDMMQANVDTCGRCSSQLSQIISFVCDKKLHLHIHVIFTKT